MIIKRGREVPAKAWVKNAVYVSICRKIGRLEGWKVGSSEGVTIT